MYKMPRHPTSGAVNVVEGVESLRSELEQWRDAAGRLSAIAATATGGHSLQKSIEKNLGEFSDSVHKLCDDILQSEQMQRDLNEANASLTRLKDSHAGDLHKKDTDHWHQMELLRKELSSRELSSQADKSSHVQVLGEKTALIDRQRSLHAEELQRRDILEKNLRSDHAAELKRKDDSHAELLEEKIKASEQEAQSYKAALESEERRARAAEEARHATGETLHAVRQTLAAEQARANTAATALAANRVTATALQNALDREKEARNEASRLQGLLKTSEEKMASLQSQLSLSASAHNADKVSLSEVRQTLQSLEENYEEAMCHNEGLQQGLEQVKLELDDAKVTISSSSEKIRRLQTQRDTAEGDRRQMVFHNMLHVVDRRQERLQMATRAEVASDEIAALTSALQETKIFTEECSDEIVTAADQAAQSIRSECDSLQKVWQSGLEQGNAHVEAVRDLAHFQLRDRVRGLTTMHAAETTKYRDANAELQRKLDTSEGLVKLLQSQIGQTTIGERGQKRKSPTPPVLTSGRMLKKSASDSAMRRPTVITPAEKLGLEIGSSPESARSPGKHAAVRFMLAGRKSPVGTLPDSDESSSNPSLDNEEPGPEELPGQPEREVEREEAEVVVVDEEDEDMEVGDHAISPEEAPRETSREVSAAPTLISPEDKASHVRSLFALAWENVTEEEEDVFFQGLVSAFKGKRDIAKFQEDVDTYCRGGVASAPSIYPPVCFLGSLVGPKKLGTPGPGRTYRTCDSCKSSHRSVCFFVKLIPGVASGFGIRDASGTLSVDARQWQQDAQPRTRSLNGSDLRWFVMKRKLQKNDPDVVPFALDGVELS